MSRPLPPRGNATIISAAMWKTLCDEPLKGEERAEPYFWAADALSTAWAAWSGEVLSQWIRRYPGCRPCCWWIFSAPESQRRRLGGVGQPIWEVLPAYTEQFYLGAPALWFCSTDASFYAEIMNRQLDGQALDETFPPLFESQAAYLRRHGLLSASEARQLGPDDFAPEPITAILQSMGPA